MCLLALNLSISTGCNKQHTNSNSQGVLQVCTSSTDAAKIIEAVGGSAVSVTGFVKGEDDPHVVNATPSMVTALAEANLLVVVGLGLEDAWLPAMLDQAGNDKVKPGGEGHLDLSTNLRTVAGPEGRGVAESFHPEDNPHFLIDPVEGVKAAQSIADRLSILQPDQTTTFKNNAAIFSKRIMVALLGDHVAEKFDATRLEELAIAIETSQLDGFPHLNEDAEVLGGWLGALRKHTDTPVIGDHDLWPYLARRYGIRVINYLDPEPGIEPTIPHLQEVISNMKTSNCRIILTVQYFEPRHSKFVAEATGATIVPMANQPGARPGTASYLDFVNYNAEQVLKAVQAQASDTDR